VLVGHGFLRASRREKEASTRKLYMTNASLESSEEQRDTLGMKAEDEKLLQDGLEQDGIIGSRL